MVTTLLTLKMHFKEKQTVNVNTTDNPFTTQLIIFDQRHFVDFVHTNQYPPKRSNKLFLKSNKST